MTSGWCSSATSIEVRPMSAVLLAKSRLVTVCSRAATLYQWRGLEALQRGLDGREIGGHLLHGCAVHIAHRDLGPAAAQRKRE